MVYPRPSPPGVLAEGWLFAEKATGELGWCPPGFLSSQEAMKDDEEQRWTRHITRDENRSVLWLNDQHSDFFYEREADWEKFRCPATRSLWWSKKEDADCWFWEETGTKEI